MHASNAGPLRLESLRGDWLPVQKTNHYLPSLASPLGSVAVTSNLCGICSTIFHPVHLLNVPVLEVRHEGKPVGADETRWAPHEIERRTRFDEWELHSTLRIVQESPGVLLRLRCANTAAQARGLALTMDARVACRSYRGQVVGFIPPSLFQHKAEGHRLRWFEGIAVTEDAASTGTAALGVMPAPGAVEADTLSWTLDVPPGESREIVFAVALGEEFGRCLNARTWSDDFERYWERATTQLETRWREVFDPNGRMYPGYLPIPATDDEALLRCFTNGVMDLFYCERHYRHLQPRRRFVTAMSPLGCAVLYYWEGGLCADSWARLDEPGARAYLLEMLEAEWMNSYAIDFHTGEPLGVWYAFNAYAVWKLAAACLRYATDGLALLDREVQGRPVGDWLREAALSWRLTRDPKTGMMHGGDKWNLLECVDGYEHIVPATNAIAVAFLRDAAGWMDAWRGAGEGDELRRDAQELLPKVLDLYEGEGWWACLRDDGERRVVRSLFDMVTLDDAIGRDLPDAVAAEMLEAVRRELIAGNWMFALSPQDPEAVERSAKGDQGRNDHGWRGSYGAWVAHAALMFHRHGRTDEALDILRRAASIARQGPYGQAVAATGTPGEELKCNPFANVNGSAFAEVVLEILGSRPSIC